MTNQNVQLIQSAFTAYLQGDLDALLALVDPNLKWTYLDPSEVNPAPQVCHGRAELRRQLMHRHRDLPVELEEVRGHGDRVLVVLHVPGIDQRRARQARDRNYSVVTVQEGRITALRACRDRAEALQFAGLAS